jgi:P27 family predicted phage terminase small subunit
MAKRTPIEVKKLNGTFRDDRYLPDYARLDTVKNIPTPPATLSKAAHEVWYIQVSAMQQMRTLTEADFVLLELFCEQKALYNKALKRLNDDDELVDETNNGATKMISQYIKIMDGAIRNMIDLSKKLGFSPLDRSSIGVTPSQPNDPLKELLKK